VLVVTLLAGIAWWQRNEAIKQRQEAVAAKNDAEEEARIAESRRLAAESSSALTKYPQRGLLFAVEAVNVGKGVRVAAAEQSLREALAYIGGRTLAVSSWTHAVGISPDSRWLVTGSEDGTVRLWDLTAKELAANPIVLRGHNEQVNAVAISPDNRWVVTGSGDNTARLWDLSAKDPAANPVVLRGHEGPVGREW
jgi:hypothetical protein